MKLKIFSVYDTKALAHLPPFYAPTTGMAVRMFKDAVNDGKHEFWKNPGDYTLYELGTFDDTTGELAPEKPRSHGIGLQYRIDDRERLESQADLIEAIEAQERKA